jgi:hypothetical protein
MQAGSKQGKDPRKISSSKKKKSQGKRKEVWRRV